MNDIKTGSDTGIIGVKDAADTCAKILDEMEKAVIGKRMFLSKLFGVALAEGHALIEDKPGLAKTVAARSMARILGTSFKRIQFTPDLLPSDITGTYILDRNTGTTKLVKGPIFANFVLADEINRAPPKTQSALLEGMEERHATLEGETLDLPKPFMVIATQNPIEYEGTFPLPEAQLDRFLARLDIGYPGFDDEVEIAMRRFARDSDDPDLACFGSDTLQKLICTTRAVHVDRDIAEYAAALARSTRDSASVAVGASPRATLALLKLARAHALMDARTFIVPDDVKWCAVEVLVHRILLKPDVWADERRVVDVVNAAMATVPVPKARES